MKLASAPKKRQRVINQIRKNIETGAIAPGERLIPIREIANRFGVSLSVVQNALKELSEGGYIECRGITGFYVRENPTAEEKTAPGKEMPHGAVFLSCNHHSDLMWRRTYAEYADLREKQIQNLLRIAEKHHVFHFSFDQAEVVAVYLQSHPEDLPRLRTLLKNGQMELMGGLCIPDLNMVSGESILRNQLIGQAYWKKMFGVKAAVASMFDAFGMCGQLPQILRLCGFEFLIPSANMPNPSPTEAEPDRPFRWVGLDGTEIPTAKQMVISHDGYFCNVPVMLSFPARLAESLNDLKYLSGDSLAAYSTEEPPILEEIVPLVDAANRSGECRIQFRSSLDFFKTLKDRSLPEIRGEFNPIFTGCYATRIGCKQRVRKAENDLFKLEFIQAVTGKKQDLSKAWHELGVTQFHDAICGCHTDAAHRDFVRKTDSIPAATDTGLNLCNFTRIKEKQLIATALPPKGIPSQASGDRYLWTAELPPFGAKSFAPAARKPTTSVQGEPVFETRFFQVDFRQSEPVIRLRNGKNIFASEGFGRLWFRTDFGTMWIEKFLGPRLGKEFIREKVESIQTGPVFTSVTVSGEILPGPPMPGNDGTHWNGFGSLTWRKEYLFFHELDYFKLKLKLDWRGSNTKIGIGFPLTVQPDETRALFEVPFGTVERAPYFEVESRNSKSFRGLRRSDYWAARGDWPALNWISCGDYEQCVAVANTGTPGHQVVNGEVSVSLIRSGTETADGGMTPQPGAMDNGEHGFEFAFRPHSPMEMEKAYELGTMLNRPPAGVPGMLEGSVLDWNEGNIALSALYAVPEGVLVRWYETLGRETPDVKVTSSLGRLFECRADGSDPAAEPSAELFFKPFEVKTFLIKK